MVNQQFSMALHVLTVLGYSREEMLNSEHLARSVNTHPVVIRRILQRLSLAGFIETQRGARGGVRLKQAPELIDLRQIYQAVETPELLSRPTKNPHRPCPVSCQMKDIVESLADEAETCLLNYLKDIRLSHILKRMK